LCARFLQCLDRFLKAQPERLQQSCRRAFSVAYDGSKHDGAINLASPRLLCGLPGRLQHPMQLHVHIGLGPGFRPHVFQQATQVARHVRSKLDGVDVTGAKDARRVGVLDKREKQVLEKHGTMRLGSCETARSLKALGEVRRHRNCFELFRNALRHSRLLTAGCRIRNGPPRGHARLTRRPS
jgi:hypothetical protein